MSKKNLEKLQDKMSYVHYFAGILADHSKVNDFKTYPIDEQDFVDKFHKIIYACISNMQKDGVKKITPLEIVTYLSKLPAQMQIFESNEGEEYLERLVEVGISENFDYHYNRIKKFTLLRHYYINGIDFSDIYSIDDFMSPEDELLNNAKFNEITIDQIIKQIDSKIIKIKEQFSNKSEGYEGHVSENIKNMLAQKKVAPSYGANYNSGYYNTMTRGARIKKLYCKSGDSGSGKTRSGLADTLGMCTPYIYDTNSNKWITTGANGSGLFITTELEEEEIKIPAVCYIAGVDEEKINENNLTFEEEERLQIAADILAKSNFWIVELFDFDTEDLEFIIEKYVNQYNVEYIFFDYLHTTLKMFEMMSKKGAKNLAEHQILRIMTIHLKNMCNNLGVHIDTSTQLSDGWNKIGVQGYTQSALEGSKSIVNKLDLGALQVPLTPEDEEVFEELKHSLNLPFGLVPTHTINIYKNRGNRWKKIRIWIHFDLGTLRITDLFVTNYKNVLIEVTPKKIKYLKQEEEKSLNHKEMRNLLENFEISISNIEIKKEHIPDEEVKISLQEELREVYEEAFEDTLPESIEKEIEGFGESKSISQRKREEAIKALGGF